MTPPRNALLDLWRRGYDAGQQTAERQHAGDLALGTALRKQAEIEQLITEAVAVLATAMLGPREEWAA